MERSKKANCLSIIYVNRKLFYFWMCWKHFWCKDNIMTCIIYTFFLWIGGAWKMQTITSHKILDTCLLLFSQHFSLTEYIFSHTGTKCICLEWISEHTQNTLKLFLALHSVQMLIYFGHVKICRIFSATSETPTNELYSKNLLVVVSLVSVVVTTYTYHTIMSLKMRWYITDTNEIMWDAIYRKTQATPAVKHNI